MKVESTYGSSLRARVALAQSKFSSLSKPERTILSFSPDRIIAFILMQITWTFRTADCSFQKKTPPREHSDRAKADSIHIDYLALHRTNGGQELGKFSDSNPWTRGWRNGNPFGQTLSLLA